MTLLSVKGLTRRFGGVTAVDDVSFEVHSGMIKALIGPNGAGKSTVFNLLTAFDRPDAGSVVFCDESLMGLRPHQIVKRGLARTFQNTQLFDEMTALENVLVPLTAPGSRRRGDGGACVPEGSRSLPRRLRALASPASHRTSSPQAASADVTGRAHHLLRQVGIADWADTMAADIPHGVRRSLEIARALATGPRLLLLDEPAAGLNASESAQLIESLYRIRDAGVTIIIVEHDMGLVMRVSDEIVVLDRGRKIAEGPPLLIQKDARVIEAYLGEEVTDADA